jgi:hypothetical protein
MPDVTADCFSRVEPLEILTPFPDASFSEWRPLAAALSARLEGLRPGSIRYRLTENISLDGDTLPLEIPLPARVRWRIAFYRRGEGTLLPLDCAATLIREETELVATRLELAHPLPEPAEESPSPPGQIE